VYVCISRYVIISSHLVHKVESIALIICVTALTDRNFIDLSMLDEMKI
jgi:hypothetical protein